MKWFEIKNQTEDTAEVWIYDVIGEDFWGEGVSAKRFVKELADITASQIYMHINSPGGSVWDGQAIYNAVKRHPANVTTYVDGLAASIASVIALAGNQVVMAENALMMIHDPWAMTIGTADEMRASADVLDKVGETIRAVYERRTGKDSAEIKSAMIEETWYTASEAVEYGLADQVEEGLAAVALVIDPEIRARYKHVPAQVAEKTTPKAGDLIPTTTNSQTISIAGAVVDDDGGAPIEESKPIDFELEKIRLRR
jgi:ATP-dependent Clp endopeptidase proteolytic subunit ClpP